MATQTTISKPAPFVEKLGTNLAENVLAQQGVPVVAPIDPLTGQRKTLTQFAGEADKDFAARQQAAQRFDIRQQNLAGLAPQVAGQDALQTAAQGLAVQGLGSFEPFLNRAQTQADLAAGLAGDAKTGLGEAGQTLGTGLKTLDQAGVDLSLSQGILAGTPLGAQAFQQGVSQFMSPYQSQVIDATLAEFDRNKAIQEQSIRDQQTALGALGSGRAGVQLSEFGTGAARERALLQAGLLQEGFGQAMQARQQDIANRFGLAQATQGLGAFQSGLAGQQAALGTQAAGIAGTNISRLGSLGALNQAQTQAGLDATREANRMAAYQPQEQLQNYGNLVTGIMGGMAGSGTQVSQIPDPGFLQTALGAAATGAGIYGALKKP